MALVAPLFSSVGSNLLNHFQKYVVDQELIPESRENLIMRRIFQGLSVTLGIGGRLPFAASSFEYAGSNKVLGWFLVTGNVASFSCFCTDCLLSITADEVRPLSKEEKQMLRNDQACLNRIKKASLVAIGILSQFPLAYLCYSTNNNNLLIGAVVQIDAGLPIYSLNLSAKAWAERQSALTPLKEQILAAKGLMIGAVHGYRAKLPAFYRDEDMLIGLPKTFDELMNAILDSIPEQEKIAPAVKTIGAIFSAAQLAFYSALTYSGMKKLTDNEPASIAASVGVTACNAYLQGDVLVRSVQDRWNTTKSLFQANPNRSLARTCFPILSTALSGVNVLLSAFSFAPSAVVAREYFPGPYGEAEAVIGSVATGLLVTNSLQGVFDNFTLWLGKNTRLGNDKMREIIDLDARLQRFALTLRDAPLSEFEEFLKAIPPEMTKKLVSVNGYAQLYAEASTVRDEA